MGERVGHLSQHLAAHVLRRVAGLVVAGVEGLAGASTELGSMIFALGAARAREEAECWDSSTRESRIIRAVAAFAPGPLLHGKISGREVLRERLGEAGRGARAALRLGHLDEAPEIR